MLNASTLTIGCDLGDRISHICVLNVFGKVMKRQQVKSTRSGFIEFFEGLSPSRVVMEVGGHSRWASQLVASFGHEIFVANARQVRLIHASNRKSDRIDAEKLARLARFDPAMLAPIVHRSDEAQADLAIIRCRDLLVRQRTAFINSVRGIVKSAGYRLVGCATENFHKRAPENIPEALRPALEPAIAAIAEVTRQIKIQETRIKERLQKYPEAENMMTIYGVGPLTALTLVLVVEDLSRLKRPRSIGAYAGLVPRLSQSGNINHDLNITKAGDRLLRQYLVQCAHRIMMDSSPDSALKQFGLRLFERGGACARRKAIVAVARKLAVVMIKMWQTGQEFRPFPEQKLWDVAA